MTQFWGKLFGINFAMGVTTGITLEFQFGTNWSYSHYVGDIFGVPLAVEGLMAFFLESTFVGLFFFGWNRLSKVKHLMVTFLVALGSNLSALWILVANGWMNNPVGAEFNYQTMRMEMTSLFDVLFNPVAQVKFVHTVSAGYVSAAMFVLGVSSWYLLKKRDVDFALRSFAVAAGFGLAATLCVIVLGDESGYTTGEVQKMKLAAIESEWETQPAPASFTLIGIPNQEEQRTDYAIKIPYALGLIATRSIDEPVIGLRGSRSTEEHIQSGMVAYGALQKIKQGDTSDATRAVRPAQAVSRLRADAQAVHAERGRRDARADQGRREEDDPAGRARVLLVPDHGGPRLPVRRDVHRRVLVLRANCCRTTAAGSSAMRCGRSRCRGSRSIPAGSSPARPPAVDDRRRAADAPVRVEPATERPVPESRGLHPVLYRAVRHRDQADVQVRAPSARRCAYRPLSPRNRGRQRARHGVSTHLKRNKESLWTMQLSS